MRISPYLNFDGRCEEAFTFYAKCFGLPVPQMMKFSDAPKDLPVTPGFDDKVMHTRIDLGSAILMGADAIGGRYGKPQGITVSLMIDDVEKTEQLFAALSAGGSVMMPLQETFWAKRFGMFTDRFDIPWMLNCEKAM